MLSLMAKEMTKEEHLKHQSRSREEKREVAEAAKREVRSSISQGVEDRKEAESYSVKEQRIAKNQSHWILGF